MELCQTYWGGDDQRNLFLEFKKDERENPLFLPGTIKKINLKYELSKLDKREIYQTHQPDIISIKTFYFFNKFIAFFIDMSEVSNIEYLQIKILKLSIILYSGKKTEYSVSRTFILSEICINEECYTNFCYEEFKTENKTENSLLHEKVYKEVETDLKNNKEKSTFIYEKKTIKNNLNQDFLVKLVNKNTEAMSNIVEQLKELNSTLKNISINNIGPISPGFSQTGPPKKISNWRPNPNLSNPKLALKAPGKLPYLAELKGVMKDGKTFQNYLKPLSEKELNNIILNDEELEKKQELVYERQIKRLEKEQSKELTLENLKNPNN